MSKPDRDGEREAMWERQNEEFRDPAEIVAYWQGARSVDRRLLEFETQGKWWETLHDLDITLLVTREYEHLLLGMSTDESAGPVTSLMRLPHPSGLAVDRENGVVHVASTRNPNQIFDFAPLNGLMSRLDVPETRLEDKLLVPVRTRILPGCLYIHDLAMVGGELHANSVGQNAVVRLHASGRHERVWWPRCIETDDGPVFGQNHLQLNSIAAGDNLESSFFSASTDEVTDLRPGDPDFPVDRRGVIFSGESREPVARDLTRPHSARFYKGEIWVDNSGYGEVGFIEGEKFRPVSGLPGWTRGLCFSKNTMFVGTSRVLPRFRQYAPGLDVDSSRCGVHAIDTATGRLLGSIFWPFGSQIFSVDWLPRGFAKGLPFSVGSDTANHREKLLFYSFQVEDLQED
ncbi:MAG: DUF4915 domain-containing protein [Desulfomonile tiedjei]|nr:DUF4915 domain-containing protein [Desulfomonile tiedjei]